MREWRVFTDPTQVEEAARHRDEPTHQEEIVSDITPLHILLSAMRKKWKADDVDGAVALARIAAPYMHPKVPAARPIGDLSGVSDDELDRIERDLRARGAWESPGES